MRTATLVVIALVGVQLRWSFAAAPWQACNRRIRVPALLGHLGVMPVSTAYQDHKPDASGVYNDVSLGAKLAGWDRLLRPRGLGTEEPSMLALLPFLWACSCKRVATVLLALVALAHGQALLAVNGKGETPSCGWCQEASPAACRAYGDTLSAAAPWPQPGCVQLGAPRVHRVAVRMVPSISGQPYKTTSPPLGDMRYGCFPASWQWLCVCLAVLALYPEPDLERP